MSRGRSVFGRSQKERLGPVSPYGELRKVDYTAAKSEIRRREFPSNVVFPQPARAAAAKKIKDNGIDIIAWRRSIDNLPCTLYLIAQVASGEDWVDKSVVMDREHFHKYWFTALPGSQPSDAMFMPFGLEPEDPGDGTPYEEVLKDYMQSVGYRYGTLFYRDRIAKHLATGLGLVAGGEQNIERVGDIAKIVKWVEKYTERLRAA